MRIDKHGIWYMHAKKHLVHNDEVCWIWPWRRKQNGGNKILSVLCEGSFKSFKELDKFWEDYVKAVER